MSQACYTLPRRVLKSPYKGNEPVLTRHRPRHGRTRPETNDWWWGGGGPGAEHRIFATLRSLYLETRYAIYDALNLGPRIIGIRYGPE